jgi:hypothetical protein
MIKVVKATVNIVALTLTEKRLVLTPTTYLFEFESQSTAIKTYCIGVDTSSWPDRYNLFDITEQVSPDPLQAEVELEEGFYTYKVYDNANSTTNIDPTGLTLLEEGFAKSIGTAVTTTTYTGGNSTYTVFA